MLKLVLRQKLALILLLALIARLAFLFIFGSSLFFFEQTGQIHGSSAYDAYAQNLIATGVYGREAGIPDARIAPLYSYLVAAIYSTIGRGGLQIGLVHIALDLITIACVYDISRRLFKNEWVGAGAAIFTAFYPYLIFQNLSLNDTALFMAEMHLFIWLLVRLWEAEKFNRKTLLWAILAGIVLGIATLTRALLPLFAVLAALWFIFRHGLRETILRLLPVAIISLIILLPWISRSYGIYGRFVAVALNTGENLWQGANPMTIPLFEAGYDVQWSVPPEASQTMDEQTKQDLLSETGLNYLRENPQIIPRLLWVKFLVHWSIDIAPRNNPLHNQQFSLDENGNLLILDNTGAPLQDVGTIAQYESGLFATVARPLHIAYFGGLLLLAILGIGLSLKHWRELSILWFLQLSMMLMYMIFHPSTRYRLPTDPLLFAFSAYALVWLWNRFRRPLA